MWDRGKRPKSRGNYAKKWWDGKGASHTKGVSYFKTNERGGGGGWVVNRYVWKIYIFFSNKSQVSGEMKSLVLRP